MFSSILVSMEKVGSWRLTFGSLEKIQNFWVSFHVGCLRTVDYNLTTGTARLDSPPAAYLPDNGENLWRKKV